MRFGSSRQRGQEPTPPLEWERIEGRTIRHTVRDWVGLDWTGRGWARWMWHAPELAARRGPCVLGVHPALTNMPYAQ